MPYPNSPTRQNGCGVSKDSLQICPISPPVVHLALAAPKPRTAVTARCHPNIRLAINTSPVAGSGSDDERYVSRNSRSQKTFPGHEGGNLPKTDRLGESCGWSLL